MPNPTEASSPAEIAACRSGANGAPCAACRKAAGEIVPVGTLHTYSSQPRGGWAARRLPDPADAATPTFGIELETALAERPADLRGRPTVADPYSPTAAESAALIAWERRNRAHLARERAGRLSTDEACAVAGPRGHWHSKADGSVSGPEFVSQPSTLAYWRSIRPQVASMMRALVHGGLRAHDTRYSCSMHVNIGVASFADAGHLARFARLATMNPRWSTALAQRTHDQVRMWARFDAYPDMAACTRMAESVFRNGWYGSSHSDAINASHDGRIEFRVPRGTLRIDRFMGKIEWCASMVEYTRDATRPVNPAAYVQWVLAHRAEWRDLVALMADVTPARVAA